MAGCIMFALDEWAFEAKRLHRRYLVEIVEAFGLCPWAQRARLDGQTRIAVLLEKGDTVVGPSIGTLDRWTDDGIEVGFLVYPRLRLGRLDFERLVAHLRSVYAAQHSHGSTPFALAAFHPEAAPDLNDPERLVPFLRRTPDPCVQAIRVATLERVRRGTPVGTQFIDVASLDATVAEASATTSLRDRIAQTNLETVRRAGVQALAACFDAIEHDRVRTYQALEAREDCAPIVVDDGPRVCRK